MKFYCVKCKESKEVPESKVKYEMKNGRRMAMAKCPDCGTRMVRFVPKK